LESPSVFWLNFVQIMLTVNGFMLSDGSAGIADADMVVKTVSAKTIILVPLKLKKNIFLLISFRVWSGLVLAIQTHRSIRNGIHEFALVQTISNNLSCTQPASIMKAQEIDRGLERDDPGKRCPRRGSATVSVQ
jgi:hypothetical protein